MANLTRSIEEFKTALLGQLEETSAALKRSIASIDTALLKQNERSAYLAQQAKQGIKFHTTESKQSDQSTPTPTFGKRRGG